MTHFMQCKDCELWTTKRCSKSKRISKEGKWGTAADETSCDSFALDFEVHIENKAW